MNVSRHKRGFTLIELLVAAGITAFLASLMVAIVAQASELWTRSAERLRCEAVARGVFARIESDLAAAIRHDGSIAAEIVTDAAEIPSTIWEPAGSHSKPGGSISIRAAASLAESRFGVGGIWLRLVTTRLAQNRDLDSVSAPVAVGYRIARHRRLPAETTAGYVLCRAEVRPGASGSHGLGTLETGYDLAAPAYLTNIMGASGDPATITRPFLDAPDSPVIADGIIDFGVRGYVRDTTGVDGLRQILPGEEASGGVQPDIVDVMIRVLTDTGVQRISRLESGADNETTAAEAWWALALANSHVFTRRIALVASSP